MIQELAIWIGAVAGGGLLGYVVGNWHRGILERRRRALPPNQGGAWASDIASRRRRYILPDGRNGGGRRW